MFSFYLILMGLLEILCFDIKFFVCVMFYDGGVLGFFKNYYFFFCKFDIVVILRWVVVKFIL